MLCGVVQSWEERRMSPRCVEMTWNCMRMSKLMGYCAAKRYSSGFLGRSCRRPLFPQGIRVSIVCTLCSICGYFTRATSLFCGNYLNFRFFGVTPPKDHNRNWLTSIYVPSRMVYDQAGAVYLLSLSLECSFRLVLLGKWCIH